MLKKKSYIYYLVQFLENQKQVKTLLNRSSQVNVLSLSYTMKLGLKIRKINVGAQKIEHYILNIFGMVIPDFQIKDKVDRPRIFRKLF